MVEQKVPREPKIIDKGFAKRLEEACVQHPLVPTDEYRGKKKWIYDNLKSQFGVEISPESVRKYFTGEARPKPKLMGYLARLLEVDEAWLSLGITPDLRDKRERKAFDAKSDGAVSAVIGLMQMNGITVAVPKDDDKEADFSAIVGGKHYRFEVKAALPETKHTVKFIAKKPSADLHLIGVVSQEDTFLPKLLLIGQGALEAAGQTRGAYTEISVENRGTKFWAGSTAIPEITDFRQLETLIEND